MNRSPVRARRAILAVLASVLMAALAPGVTSARSVTYETYAMKGFEVWFSSTVGYFVGAGTGNSPRDISAWYTAVEHTVAINPQGRVTGGWATLRRIDGVSIQGKFTDGRIVQINEGANCTRETHKVKGMLNRVTRTDQPGKSGVGYFEATLTHYRALFFGTCYSYSASVNGTITVAV